MEQATGLGKTDVMASLVSIGPLFCRLVALCCLDRSVLQADGSGVGCCIIILVACFAPLVLFCVGYDVFVDTIPQFYVVS